MDANGQRFWMLSTASHWAIADGSNVSYDQHGLLRLANIRGLTELDTENAADAEGRLQIVPQALDTFGTRAFFDAGSGTIKGNGAFEEAVEIDVPLQGQQPTDLALGFDDVLYVAVGGGVLPWDVRRRWRLEEPVVLADFDAWRLSAHPHGGVWVLDRDRDRRKIARLQGLPLPDRPLAEYAPGTFRLCEENRDPPRMTAIGGPDWIDIPATIDTPADNERPVAIACGSSGRLALLSWTRGGALLRLFEVDKGWSGPWKLGNVQRPYSCAWVSDERFAVLVARTNEAPAYDVPGKSGDLAQVGDVYPLRNHDGGPFVHVVSQPPHYPTVTNPLPLHRFSLPAYAPVGTVSNRSLLDSGVPATEWHRLYLEAVIPAGTAVVVKLAATDKPEAPPSEAEGVWHEHHFGQVQTPSLSAGVPRAAWLSIPSEVSYHPGLLLCPREKNRAGLFTVLIQRPGRRVRTLRGRYLWVRLELIGSTRGTPQIAALRAYAPRFSYRDQYLPELYRESDFAREDELDERSSPADFLERFLDNAEGVLTVLEDRIAHAHLLTDPRSVPDAALEWLGGWIGVLFDSAYPPSRRRELIAAAPALFGRRGTLKGLRYALEIATGGGVSGGEIIVLEDFRLRRTFSTILGADLADESDPVMGGLVVSGNSYVGDTLFLGEEHKKEFLALFAADLPVSSSEEHAIAALFDRLAHRATVLVHHDIEPQDLGLIRRIVALEAPAHISTQVLTATHPFLVGIASLVGVDTYLRPEAPRLPVRVDRSRIGERDFVLRTPSLDPRLEATS